MVKNEQEARWWNRFNRWQVALIQEWCEQHLGRVLPITCQKDFQMIALYDDRAIGVVTNTGALVGREA